MFTYAEQRRNPSRQPSWLASCLLKINYIHTIAAVLILFVVVVETGKARAATINSRFNPNDHTSNGTLTLNAGDSITFNTLAGSYTINGGAPVVGGSVVTSQSGNVKLMMFNFDTISIANGVTVNVTGDYGLVLGSRQDITLNSTINVSGTNSTGVGANVGAGGPGAEGGTTGATFNSNGTPYDANAGNGGNGNNAGNPSVAGRGFGGGASSGGAGRGGSYAGLGGNNNAGTTYGDNALTDLYGGSGGGGGSGGNGGGAGAGGGGAIELTALGTITIDGALLANGGTAANINGSATRRGGGGGSGGGILLNASNIVLNGSSTLSARGGNGGLGDDGSAAKRGEAGGGGRVAIYGDNITQAGTIDVSGGTLDINGGPGTSQTFSFTPTMAFYWTGDLNGTWNALSIGNTNWSSAAGLNTDEGYRPVSTSDVFLSVDNSVGAGNANTALGADTSINSLTFTGTGTAAAGTSYTIAAGNTLTIGTGGITVQSGSSTHTINSDLALGAAQNWLNDSNSVLTINGDVANGTNLLTIAGSGNTTINGDIGSGAGGLSMNGSGTLRLAGNNSYSGTTNINSGTVIIAGTHLGGGLYTIANGATLGGAGTIDAPVTLSGAIAPGNSPGTLTTGSQIWNDGGMFQFEIDDALTGTAGSDAGWTLLSINGTLDLTGLSPGGFTIDIDSLLHPSHNLGSLDVVPSTEYVWEFVNTSGGILGFNTNLFTFNTGDFSATTAGNFTVRQTGDSLELVFTTMAVPEPFSMAIWLLTGAGIVAVWRRRFGIRS